MKFGTPDEGFPIDTVIEAFVISRSIANIREALVEISAARRNKRSMRILGVLRDDVDDGVDGICSPDGSARTPDNLDPFNIIEQSVLDLPIDARKERRVNAPPVDQHQY